MRIRFESRLARLAVLLGVVALLTPYALMAASRYRAARLASRNDKLSLQRAIEIEPGDAEYQRRLARYALYVDQDTPGALLHYQVATNLNRYSAPSWLGVAQSQLILGNEAAALEAIRRALEIDPHTPSVAWEAGNLLVALGQADAAMPQFRFVAENDPAMTIQVLQLLRRLESSPARAAQLGLPPDPGIHFIFINLLAQSGDIEGAKQVWPIVMGLRRSFDPRHAFFFLDLLVKAGQPEVAYNCWRELAKTSPDVGRLNQAGNLLENASFEHPILNGGFDWRYLPSPEVDIQAETSDAHEGSHSLLAKFKGQRTSDAGMHQYVLLEPNARYHFRGFVKSDLQTANGFRFMLVDAKTGKHLFDTNDTIGDRQWTEYSADFRTSADTRLAVFLLGRNNTTLVRGNLLIDDLRLEKVTP
ncbi:MAG TPA: carbohydrate binding domain-containing protein [Terriglobales bacterium]